MDVETLMKENGIDLNFQTMPFLSLDDFQDLMNDIKENGPKVPVLKTPSGLIVDGHHRFLACKLLKIPCPTQILNVSDEEAETLSYSLNLKRRHLTRKEIQELVKKALRRHPEWSDRQLAKTLKDASVAPSTISRNRKRMEQSGELLQCNTCQGLDGRTRKRKAAPTQPEQEPTATAPDTSQQGTAPARQEKQEQAAPLSLPVELLNRTNTAASDVAQPQKTLASGIGRKILDCLKVGEDEGLTARELAAIFNTDRRAITRAMNALRKAGFKIVATGSGYFYPPTESTWRRYQRGIVGRVNDISAAAHI